MVGWLLIGIVIMIINFVSFVTIQLLARSFLHDLLVDNLPHLLVKLLDEIVLVTIALLLVLPVG